MSLPVRGAWIEIAFCPIHHDASRSLPVRGAWIEILIGDMERHLGQSLPVRGAWIEICDKLRSRQRLNRRSPCGERGLKSMSARAQRTPTGASLPVRGAWIEISRGRCRPRCGGVAPRAGSVD